MVNTTHQGDNLLHSPPLPL